MSNAGWYDDGSGRQRWWDGEQWGQFADAAPASPVMTAAMPETAVKKSRGIGIAALVVGIVAFLVGIVPVVGAIIGAAGIALAIIALVKKQPKGLAVTALILSALAFIASIGVTAGITANLPKPKPAAIQTVEPSEAASDAPPVEETTEPEEAEAPPAVDPPADATPDLATFYPTDDRSWALVAKDPDSYSGTNIILYGSIMQFDSATGRCAMLISMAATQKEYSFDYDTNTMAYAGDAETTCPVFDPLVENDNVKVWATIDSSYSYDTQIGGNTTVPLIKVWYAELLPATEY